MVNAVKAAQAAARQAQESMYFGVATVYEYQKTVDENHLSTEQEVAVLERQPCRLAFGSKNQAVQSENGNKISQTIKLFLAPDVEIKPGSKITVTQDGVTNDYANSGVPAVYPTHQEIVLELFGRWA